jgi:hypothetical protein
VPAVNVLAVKSHVTVLPETEGVNVAWGQFWAPEGQ